MIVTGLSNLQTIIIYMLHHVDTAGHDLSLHNLTKKGFSLIAQVA